MKRSDFLSLLGVSSLLGVLGGLAKRTEAKGEGEVVNLAYVPVPVARNRQYAVIGIGMTGEWISLFWDGPLGAPVQICKEIYETPVGGNWTAGQCIEQLFRLNRISGYEPDGELQCATFVRTNEPGFYPHMFAGIVIGEGVPVMCVGDTYEKVHELINNELARRARVKIADTDGNLNTERLMDWQRKISNPDPDVTRFCEAMDANSGDGTFDSAAMDKSLKWMMQAS